jgi:hypothetical protein
MLTEPHTPGRRRAIPNIAEDIALREHTHPGGFEGTDDARRYGAELLGRILGHAGATLEDFRWYEIYAAAAYDGLNLCSSLHIMAAQAMREARGDPCRVCADKNGK